MRSLVCSFIVFALTANIALPQVEKNSNAFAWLDSIEDPMEKYKLLNDSALYYSGSYTVKKYATKAKEVAQKYDLEESWKYQAAKAWQYFFEEKYDSTENLIKHIENEVKKSRDTTDVLYKYYELGYLYYNLIQYTNAKRCFDILLEKAEKNANKRYISQAYIGLCRLARNNEDYKLSNTYLDKLFDHFGEEDFFKKPIAYQLYAENAISLKEYNIAKHSLLIAKDLYIAKDNSIRLGNVFNQLGWVLNETGMVDSAISSYEKSLEISLKTNRNTLTADTYDNLGLIYFNQKKYNKAISYFNKMLELDLKSHNNLVRFAYYYLSQAYDSVGNCNEAFYNFKQFYHLNDSARNKEVEQIYFQERAKFEAERKEEKLEILSLKFKKNRNILYSSIAFIILLLTVAFLLYRQSRLKSQKRIAEFKKQVAEVKQLSLRQQMNPHFVFNTLNSIQFFMFQNDKKSTNNYMSKFAMLIRKTLENSQHNSIPIKYEIEALRLYIELEQLRFKENFDYVITIDEEIDILQHKIPTMLIQPFVENAINHGLHLLEKNGRLLIDFKLLNNTKIECSIEDNGIGREKAEEIKRTKRSKHNSLGTSITQERLKIIDPFVSDKLKIEYIDLKDTNGGAKGTKVIIHIPIIA